MLHSPLQRFPFPQIFNKLRLHAHECINVVSLNVADKNKKLKWFDTFMYSSPASNLIKVRSGVLEMLRDHNGRTV